MPEPFTIERALPLMDEAGVDRVVIVPPGLNDVNSYALEAARRYPEPLRGDGPHPAGGPEIGGAAAEVEGAAGHARRAGVVQQSQVPRPCCRMASVDWFWPAAEKAGLPVMFLAFGRVNMFDQIAERHPGLPLIIDHMGVNAAIAKEGRTAEVIGHAVALAKYPNVSVKLSNLPNASLEPYPFRDLTAAHPPRVRRLRAAALLLGDRRDERDGPGRAGSSA